MYPTLTVHGERPDTLVPKKWWQEKPTSRMMINEFVIVTNFVGSRGRLLVAWGGGRGGVKAKALSPTNDSARLGGDDSHEWIILNERVNTSERTEGAENRPLGQTKAECAWNLGILHSIISIKYSPLGCQEPGHLADEAGTFREERVLQPDNAKSNSSGSIEISGGNGYSEKDEKQSQNDKTEHGMEKYEKTKPKNKPIMEGLRDTTSLSLNKLELVEGGREKNGWQGNGEQEEETELLIAY
ncbi:hypothetical protein Tco_0699701 [Tanacetum coccineum]